MNDTSSKSRGRRAVFRCGLALVILCTATTLLQAQNSVELTATYGRGVHAYFASQADLADQLFTQVIEAGSTDPRVYYFRAMARLGCGRQYEAEADMRLGAAFEARDPGNRYAISKALERVQGANRRTLEEFRQQARVDRLQERQMLNRDRYEDLRRREPDVLRREMPVPLEDLVEPSLTLPGGATARPTPAAAPAPSSQSAPTADPAPARPIPPQEPTTSPSEDPFGGEPSESEDPFGGAEPAVDESAPPAEVPEAPAEEANDEDPFAVAPAAGALDNKDRVESVELLGVIGRVATSMLPWRGLDVSSFTPDAAIPLDSGEPAFAAPDESATIAASAEEPVATEADAFGEAETAELDEPSPDLFGDQAAEPATAAAESDQPATADAAGDDPFGEF